MKLLIAEDRPATLSVLTHLATLWGYDVVGVGDGAAAWYVLQKEDAPKLVLLDWMLPSMDGLEVCQQVRRRFPDHPPHLILITGRGSEDDLVAGLAGGADEYLRKPVSPPELRARLDAGKRIVQLQSSLAERVRNLEQALSRVKQLQGLLPICSYCKKVRDDRNYWRQVEEYVSANSEAQFSHGICPDCFKAIVEPELSRYTDEMSLSPAQASASFQGGRSAAPSSGAEAAIPQSAAAAAVHRQAVAAAPASAAIAEKGEARPALEGRTSPRFDCSWEIRFRLQHGSGMATVRNISVGGLRLELLPAVQPGDTLTVELAGGRRSHVKDVRVIYVMPSDHGPCVAGSAFTQRLDGADLRDLLMDAADRSAPPERN